MLERLVFMHKEDGMVTFERENGETIIYPKKDVPKCYKEGDIIKAVIHSKMLIDFLGLDEEEMERRKINAKSKKSIFRRRKR